MAATTDDIVKPGSGSRHLLPVAACALLALVTVAAWIVDSPLRLGLFVALIPAVALALPARWSTWTDALGAFGMVAALLTLRPLLPATSLPPASAGPIVVLLLLAALLLAGVALTRGRLHLRGVASLRNSLLAGVVALLVISIAALPDTGIEPVHSWIAVAGCVALALVVGESVQSAKKNKVTLRTLAVTATDIAAGLSIVMILGWFAESSLIVQLTTRLVPVHFNAALASLGCALAFRASGSGHDRIAVALLVLPLTVAVFTLAQEFGLAGPVVDNLLWTHRIVAESVAPGRVSAATGFALLALSSGAIMRLLLRPRGVVDLIEWGSGSLVLVITILTLTAYWLGLPQGRYSGVSTPMSLGSALILFLLGVAQILRGFADDQNATLRTVVLPLMAALAIGFATARLWLTLHADAMAASIDERPPALLLGGGLVVATLTAIALRYALIANSRTRAEKIVSIELRGRNDLLQQLLASGTSQDVMPNVLAMLRTAIPDGQPSIGYDGHHALHHQPAELAPESLAIHQSLIDDRRSGGAYSSFPSTEWTLASSADLAPAVLDALSRSGFAVCRIEPLLDRVADRCGQLVIGLPHARHFTGHELNVIATARTLCELALQRDDVLARVEQGRELYRSLVDNHPDGVLQVDAAGVIEAANDAAARLFDRSLPELIGSILAALFDPGFAPILQARLAGATHGQAMTIEVESIGHGGRRHRDIELTLVPLRHQAGIEGLFVIARDVTRFRAADRALRRTYEQSLHLRDQLLRLNQIAIAAAATNDVRALAHYLAASLRSALDARVVRVRLEPRPGDTGDRDGGEIIAVAGDSPATPAPPDSLARLAAGAREPILRARADLAAWLTAEGEDATAELPSSWIGVGLSGEAGSAIGSVELVDKLHGEFDEDDELLAAQFAQLTASAIDRARLIQGLHRAQRDAAQQLAFARAIAGSIGDGVYAIDETGTITFMNAAAGHLLGYGVDDVTGRALESELAAKGAVPAGARALASGTTITAEEVAFQLAGGDTVPVDVSASPLRLEGEVIGAVVVFRDARERLRANEARLERDRFFELSLEMFLIADTTGRLLQVNEAFANLLGRTPHEVVGTYWQEYIHPDDLAASEAEQTNMLSTGRLEGFNNRFIDAQGKVHSLEWAASLTKDMRIFAVARDVTERLRYESERARFISHDSVTGLPRIELVEAFLDASLVSAAQRGGRVTVFYVDLDRFHAVNDSRGHATGDEALRIVAQRLSRSVGDHGRVSRIAGDEFVLVRVDDRDAIDQQDLGEAVRALVEEPIVIAQQQIFLTCSIGVSCFPENGTAGRELVRQAEAAMMRAKDEGRNAVAAFSNDELQALQDRLDLGSRLRDAIRNDELVLHFQPQISAHNWQVTGVEALVRWQNPQLGLLLPGRFIGAAEELGVIVELGQWVLETACRTAREWLDNGLADFTIAVNVSGLQLQRPDFLERVQRSLELSRLPPRYLELELTESIVMAHVDRIIASMRSLKALGVGISLDDFGSGYSSLNYLRNFPIDKLKIDQSFVGDITTDPGSAGICRAIIALGHQLGLTVAAEGVETIGQAAFLRRSECDQFQGNYFSLPMPAAQAFEILRRRFVRQEELGGTLREASASNTLLLLDDEENVLRALVRLLRRDGYNILTATRADQAFELLAAQAVQVIVSDQRMPDTNGTDFLSKVKDIYPDTVRLILSGYSDFASLTDAVNRGAVYRFVAKPWDDEELRKTIRDAFRMIETRRLSTG